MAEITNLYGSRTPAETLDYPFDVAPIFVELPERWVDAVLSASWFQEQVRF